MQFKDAASDLLKELGSHSSTKLLTKYNLLLRSNSGHAVAGQRLSCRNQCVSSFRIWDEVLREISRAISLPISAVKAVRSRIFHTQPMLIRNSFSRIVPDSVLNSVDGHNC